MSLLFLDRDGVINRDSADFIRSTVDWVPLPGSIEAIGELSRAGYHVVIASNQSGLGRGYFSVNDLEAIHQLLREQVAAHGGRIAGIYYCPHLPGDNCNCRKPATGLLQAAEAALQLSARGAPFIGDRLQDLQAAVAHGCRPVLVKTGRGLQTLAQLEESPGELAMAGQLVVFDDLAAAARAIVRDGSLASSARKHDT